MKTCNVCSKSYIPSSRHKTCHNRMNNWKGGKTRTKKGYIQVLVPEHPRGTRYVFEHILVMEEYLGRYLLPGETVHHRNGVRDDNRIENLELWSTSQPSGQRVSDKLEWAYDIIELYDGPLDPGYFR